MRILGFQKKWDKLQLPTFTTFRWCRQDKDWFIGESVKVVYKPRHQDREELGIAIIKRKDARSPDAEMPLRNIPTISDAEAQSDGFIDCEDMLEWLIRVYGSDDRFMFEPINKLTLTWLERYERKSYERKSVEENKAIYKPKLACIL